MKWLQSGMRRDLCVLLYGTDGLKGQRLKTELESHYESHVAPKQYYGALEALVDAGFVEKREEGLHDVYSLTEAGERALERHVEWVRGTTGL